MPSGQIWNLESSDAENGAGGAVAVIPAPFDDFEEESLAIGAAVELEELGGRPRFRSEGVDVQALI
jgi:hypothetical protein